MRLPALFSAFRDAHDAMYDFGDAAGNSKASAAEVWAKGLKAGYCFFMAGLEIYGTGKMLCEGFALAKACRGGCFVAGAPVWVIAEEGTGSQTSKRQAPGHKSGLLLGVKPVEEVKRGDQVVARNPQTGKVEAKRVLRTTVRTVPVVVSVGLAEGKSGKVVDTLTASREHPFYVRGKGFVPAGGLAIGNAIVTRAGPDLVVKSLTWHRRAEGYKVYNFVVEDDHSYFVGLHNGGAWVHNPGRWCLQIGPLIGPNGEEVLVNKLPGPKNYQGQREADNLLQSGLLEYKNWEASSETEARAFAERNGLTENPGAMYSEQIPGTYQVHNAEPNAHPSPYGDMPHIKYLIGKGQRGHIWFPKPGG